MNVLRTLATELAGLFVEDRYFALAIAAWLAIAGVARMAGVLPARAAGAILFAGLAFILVASVARASRSGRS